LVIGVLEVFMENLWNVAKFSLALGFKGCSRV
jgi:hypothetical protein